MRNLPRRRVHLPSNAPDEMRKARTRRFNDILEWLASQFGFQVMSLAISFSLRSFLCKSLHVHCCFTSLHMVIEERERGESEGAHNFASC